MDPRKPVFFQTSDPDVYQHMMLTTSKTVKAYCRRHGYTYESYVGVKRGYWPWHATYNRLYIYRELIERGHRGWAIYMDADAYVADLDFDLAGYLGDKHQYAAVLSRAGVSEEFADVNIGVMMLNLGDPVAHDLVERWMARFDTLSDDHLRQAENWLMTYNDQDMLQDILREELPLQPHVFRESPAVFNSMDARFIRQFMRGHEEDARRRVETIERLVDEVMNLGGPTVDAIDAAREDAAPGARRPTILQAIRGRAAAAETGAPTPEVERLIQGLYVTLLGRGADPTGLVFYSRVVKALGPIDAAPKIAGDLTSSQEYRDRVKALVA